jgi:nucleotide-binding universal stress UspA family protein
MKDRDFRFKRILCAVDFSPPSLRVFNLTLQLAAMSGARVHLLHVIPRIVPSIMDVPITNTGWTVEVEERAKREMPKLKKLAAEHGVPASAEIRVGDIDLQILKVAKERVADLVATGTHGRKGFAKWAMGSVAERLLRSCPIPFLLTASPKRAAGPPPIRRILIPCDFSDGTADSVGYGLAIAGKSQASIVLLHVIQDRSGFLGRKGMPDQLAALRRTLEDVVPARAKKSVRVESIIGSGEPFREILGAIKDSKASLVIINSHGHGFINRLLVGSTAERVVRGGAGLCPILVIPPRSRASSA